MKPLPIVFLVALGLASSGFSQNQSSPDAFEQSDEPGSVTSTAHILGGIPDGTPPPPSPPKPKFVIPSRDILSATTHQQGGRTITVQRIKPISLPPPPPPVVYPPPSPEEEAAYREQTAAYFAKHLRCGLVILGATVFRSADSAPRTLVSYWPEGSGGTVSFWSSADFGLIAAGIQSFIDSAGETNYLLMGWGYVDLDRMAELREAKGLEYAAPEMPSFQDGEAAFSIIGEQPAAEDLIAIQSLHDLYNREHDQLETAYQGRERARIQREAELKANPPRPKNITLNFWRTEKPAASKGGAR